MPPLQFTNIGYDDGHQLSVEELFNLYMEAVSEVGNARNVLEKTSPSDPFYNDVVNIFESIQRKRENLQLMICNKAHNTPDSLQYLKRASTEQAISTSSLEGVNATEVEKSPVESNGITRKHIDTAEKEQMPHKTTPAEDGDGPLVVHRRNPKTIVASSEEATPETTLPPTQIQTTASTKPFALLNSTPSSSSSKDSTATSTVASTAASTTASNQPSDIPPKSSTPSRSDSTPEASPFDEGTSEASQSENIPPSSHSGTESVLNSVLKSISSMNVPIQQAIQIIKNVFAQFETKSEMEIIGFVAKFILAPSKEHYGTELDLRYVITDEIVNRFEKREGILRGLASDKTVMLRLGNWLRFEMRSKMNVNLTHALRFLRLLQCTKKQLMDFKVMEVLEKILSKEKIGDLAREIVENARVQWEKKDSSSATNAVLETKKTEDNDTTLTEKAEVKKSTPSIRSVLKKGGNYSRVRKSVHFKPENILVTVSYFESDQEPMSHSANEDHEKAKAMEISEGRLLKSVNMFGIVETDVAFEWTTPIAIDFDGAPDFNRAEASITRGGTLEIVRTSDIASFKRPSVAFHSVVDSPLEPDGLITPELKFDYCEDERGVLINTTAKKPLTPTTPVATLAISSSIPAIPSNKTDAPRIPLSSYKPASGPTIPLRSNADHPESSRKRDRGEDWSPSLDTSHLEPKRSRVALRPQQSTVGRQPRPQDRRGLLPGSSGILPPPDRNSKPRPHRLTEEIIQLRRRDVRREISSAAEHLPLERYNERCQYFPKCQWGNNCHYIHVRK